MKTHLQQLEAESIHILREAAGQFERPTLLFSGGKDSITLLHLAQKAFYPDAIPFPLLQIDTGHNFPEVTSYIEQLVTSKQLHLIVRKVEDTMNQKNLKEVGTKIPSRNALQSYTLVDAIEEFEFDACIGGARRDEEKARAKERIFSVRNSFGQWDPKLQRPELWNIYNGHINKGENVRIFPISNWTEIDVWNYIEQQNILLPSIYYAHERKVLEINNQLVAVNEFIQIRPDDVVSIKTVRYRTVGDMTCTAAIESSAKTNAQIIQEIIKAKISERGQTRLDDQLSEAAMEDRKKNGYF